MGAERRRRELGIVTWFDSVVHWSACHGPVRSVRRTRKRRRRARHAHEQIDALPDDVSGFRPSAERARFPDSSPRAISRQDRTRRYHRRVRIAGGSSPRRSRPCATRRSRWWELVTPIPYVGLQRRSTEAPIGNTPRPTRRRSTSARFPTVRCVMGIMSRGRSRRCRLPTLRLGGKYLAATRRTPPSAGAVRRSRSQYAAHVPPGGFW